MQSERARQLAATSHRTAHVPAKQPPPTVQAVQSPRQTVQEDAALTRVVVRGGDVGVLPYLGGHRLRVVARQAVHDAAALPVVPVLVFTG